MAVNLLDLAQSALTPSVVQKLGAYLGESPASTEKAVGVAIPTLLAGLAQYGATEHGASTLFNTVTRDYAGGGILNHLGDLFAGGQTTQHAVSNSQSLLSTIFGSRLGQVGDVVGRAAGVTASTSSSLMALVLPVILGLLGRQASSQGLSSSGLASLLAGQRDYITRSAPAGLASALGLSSLSELGGHFTRAAAAVPSAAVATAKSGSNWLWPALALLALLLAGWYFLRGREDQMTQGVQDAADTVANAGRDAADSVRSAANRVMSAITLPDGMRLDVYEDSIGYNLARFLERPDPGQLPRTFVFDDLNFETDSTALTPDSYKTVDTIVSILRAYPATIVRLDGHTDNTGDAAANQKLSLDRANTVRDRMVTGGVAAARITTAGHGPDKPVASNQTDEGRAQNRRTELTVIAVK